MKIFKKKLVKSISDVLCDICGNSCTIIPDNFGPDFATLEACWGYGSKYDGKKFDIDICENCFTSTIKYLKEQRHKNFNNEPLNISGHCPFDGESYGY